MKKILYLLLFSSLNFFGQTLLDQASYTISQLNQLNDRLDNQTPFYFTENGYYGEGQEIISGSDLFLTEEEAGNFSADYTWMQTASPVNLGIFDGEPRPGENASAPANSNEIDYPEFATMLCAAWSGRTDVLTFAGQSGTKDFHSQRLARALFDLILRKAQDVKLDFTNTAKYPTNRRNDTNPIFILMGKMNRYISMYKVIEHQLTDYTPYLSNKATVDAWCLGAATFCKANLDWLNNAMFGTIPPYADNTPINNPGSDSRLEYTHYDSNSVGQYEASNVLESRYNNRIASFFGVIDAYAVNFQNTTLRNYIFDMYVSWLELAIFPDGTNFEHYRSLEDNIGSQSIGYVGVQMAEWIKIAHSHAVAVTNGMITGESVGKFYDYTTSRGSDEIFGGWNTTSTSGGVKNMTNCILNISKYYKNAANGGYNDIRFAGTGATLAMNANDRKFTSAYGLANSYLNNSEIDDFVNQKTSANYTNPADSGYGSWPHHGTGIGFGLFSLYGYIGGTNMIDVFSQGTQAQIAKSNGSSSMINFFMN